MATVVVPDDGFADAGGSTQDYGVDIGIRAVILDYLAHQKPIHDLEAGEIEVCRLPEYEIGHLVIEPAAKIAEQAVTFDRVLRVDDIEPLLDLGHEHGNLFRRVLKIVIHHHTEIATDLVQARHDRGMLTEVPGQPQIANHIR